MQRAGVDCVSLDWTVSIDEARQRIGNKDMILQVGAGGKCMLAKEEGEAVEG